MLLTEYSLELLNIVVLAECVITARKVKKRKRRVTAKITRVIESNCTQYSIIFTLLSYWRVGIIERDSRTEQNITLDTNIVLENLTQGLKDINTDFHNPLNNPNVKYVRFNGIDAPELGSVHFMKTDDLRAVYCKRMGHLSLCALHLFLRIFVYSDAADFFSLGLFWFG